MCYCLVKEDCRKDEYHLQEQNGEEDALFCTLCNAEVCQLQVPLLFKVVGSYALGTRNLWSTHKRQMGKLCLCLLILL